MNNLIFPKNANNDTNIGLINVIVFGLITVITIARSLAHIFLPDGGANSIATIISFSGSPNPNNVIYFVFALWGLSQLLMGLIYSIVLLKYRNIIPLMWILIFIEYLGRISIGRLLKPLSENYFNGTAPGEIGNYLIMPIAIIMLVFSIYTVGKREKRIT